MKEIKLTQGQVALVDDEDFVELSKRKWYAGWDKGTSSFYAMRWEAGKTVRMHRQILGLTDPKIHGDHRNHHTLNNTRVNLRIATSKQNGSNRSGAPVNSKTGVRGVRVYRSGYRAKIVSGGVSIFLGDFPTITLAAAAYAAANRLHFGEFGGMP